MQLEVVQDSIDPGEFRLYVEKLTFGRKVKYLAAVINQDILDVETFTEIINIIETGGTPVLKLTVEAE